MTSILSRTATALRPAVGRHVITVTVNNQSARPLVFIKSLIAGGSRSHRLFERMHISRAGDPAIEPRPHQISRTAHMLAGDHRAPAIHGFVDGESPGFVSPHARQNEDIRGGIQSRHCRLILKGQKTDVLKSHGIRLDLVLERSGAGHDQKRVPVIHGAKRPDNIQRTLLFL